MFSPTSSSQRNRQALASRGGESLAITSSSPTPHNHLPSSPDNNNNNNNNDTSGPPPPAFGSAGSRSSRLSHIKQQQRRHSSSSSPNGGGVGMGVVILADELTSVRSATTGTTDDIATAPVLKGYRRPRITIPLMGIFLLQLFVVVGAFVGVTTYLLETELRATDRFVREVLQQQLDDARGEVLLPLYEHLRTLQKLALGLAVYNATFPYLPMSTELAARSMSFDDALEPWKLMRVTAAVPSGLASYVYMMVCGYYSTVPGEEDTCLVWVEVGCSGEVCYITRDTNSTNIYLAGIPPTGFLDPTQTHNSTYNPGVNEEYYIRFLKNITGMIAWSNAYVWGTPGDPLWGQNIFVTSYFCLSFAPPSRGGQGCERAVAMDVNFTFTHQILEDIVQREGEAVTLVDLFNNVVYSSTDDSVPVIDPNNQVLWTIPSSPIPKVAAATAYYQACAAAAAAGAHLLSYCDTLVVLDDGDGTIIATQTIYTNFTSIIGDSSTTVGPPQLLIIKTIPRDAYYHDSHVAFQSSLTVVIVVCLVSIVASVAVFFGITNPVHQLTLNFRHASALENEKAEFGSTVITEMSDLNEEFVILNSRLATARAFLPHSILLNGGLPPCGAEGSVLMAAQLDGADADQFDVFSNTTSPTNRYPPPPPLEHAAEGKEGEEPNQSPQAPNPMMAATSVPPINNNKGRGNSPVTLPQISVAPTSSALAASGIGMHQPAHHQQHQPQFGFSDLLHRRGVAVLFVNVMSFEKILTAWPDVGMRVHAAVLHEIIGAVTARSGVVDSFHGDRFLITFNASVVCPAPAARAVEAMMELITKIFSRAHHKLVGASNMLGGQQSGASEILRSFGVRVGASCGPAMCGTIGNRCIQRFSTVGKCVGQAHSLMQYARTELLSNVISEELLTHGVLEGVSPMSPTAINSKPFNNVFSAGTPTAATTTTTTTTTNGLSNTTAVGIGTPTSNLHSNRNPLNPRNVGGGAEAPRFTPLSAADSEVLIQGGVLASSPTIGSPRELLYMFVGHGILPKDSKSTTMATMVGWRGGSLLLQHQQLHLNGSCIDDDGAGGSAKGNLRDAFSPIPMSKEGYYVVPHYLPVEPSMVQKLPPPFSPGLIPPFQQTRHGSVSRGGGGSSIATTGSSGEGSSSSREALRHHHHYQHVTAVDYHSRSGGGGAGGGGGGGRGFNSVSLAPHEEMHQS
ncbi:guanylate cyclase, putative, partial [Bodo saltans]